MIKRNVKTMDFSCDEDASLPVNFDERHSMASANTYRGSKRVPHRRPTSPAAPVPFRSANPQQLFQLDDTRLDAADTNTGNSKDVTHFSPIRTRTMKEYDQLIDELKKENFSLKLRIYLLEERIEQKLGRGTSFEDIHKANIELRVEVEGLKRDIVDKQGLLVVASNALETLEAQQKADTEKLCSERDNEKRQLLQRIERLEKLLESATEGEPRVDRAKSQQWFGAFSFIDHFSESENSDSQVGVPSMQQKVTELEIVIGDLNEQIDKYRSRIEALESDLQEKNEQIDKQATKSNVLKKTIQGLLMAVRDKDKELEQSKDEKYERGNEELKQAEREKLLEQMQSLDNEIAMRGKDLERWNGSVDIINTSLNEFLRDNVRNGIESYLGDVFSKLASLLDSMRISNVAGQPEADLLGDSLDIFVHSLNEKARAISSITADHSDLSHRMGNLEKRFREAVKERDCARQQLAAAGVQLEFLLNERSNCGDDSEDSNVNRDRLALELKGEISKLGLQLELMSHLNDVLKHRIECSSPSVESNHDERLKHLARDAETLALEVKKFSTRDNQTFEANTEQGKESAAEIKRLKFLLLSTEATVRLFSARVKHYRRKLADCDLSGQTFLTLCYSRPHSVAALDSGCAKLSLIGTELVCATKRGSASAPVTPVKNDPPVPRGCSDIAALEKELGHLRSNLEYKEQIITDLQTDFDRTRPRCSCNDVGIQTVCDGARKDISASHDISELLRRRLEELADFLEQLLQFDEHGFLDLSVVTPQRVASIRGYIDKSRELSATLSQSLISCDDGFSVVSKSVKEKSEEPVSLNEKEVESYDDGESTVVSSRDGKLTRGPGERKCCNKSLVFDSEAVDLRTHRGKFLFHLNEQNETLEQQKTVDELPSFSLLSSTFQKSLLASTNVNMSLNGLRLGERDVSESDSWSEPDRGVSQQRIGLDGSQLIPLSKTPNGSPRRSLDFLSTTSTESELVIEINKNRGQKAIHQWRARAQEVCSLKAHVHELEHLNKSLRSELVLYQQVCNVGSPASVKALSPRSRSGVTRRSRNRSGDAAAGSSRDRLEDHLLEISSLRKQLEESIRTYDQLREQLEVRLSKMCEEGSRSEYELAVGQLYSQIEERDAVICNLHIEKSNFLLETQQLNEEIRNHQESVQSLRVELSRKEGLLGSLSSESDEIRSAFALKNKALNESLVEVGQLRQSLSRAKQLLSEKEVSMKDLHDSNNALQRDRDRLVGELSRLEEEASDRRMRCSLLSEELVAKDVVVKELEAEAEALKLRVEEVAVLARKTFEEQIKRKEIEVEEGRRELESFKYQSACLQKALEETRAQLQAADTLSRSMKAEMSVYERMVTSKSLPSGLESGVSQLMSEMRSLRLQLERSVEVNVALRAKLEGSSGASLQMDAGSSDRCTSSISMPDTASSFCYNTTKNVEETSISPPFSIDRQMSKSSDYVSDGPKEVEDRRWRRTSERADGTCVYSSPDLGIESDPSRFSSLERGPSFPLQTSAHYLEPGVPNPNSDWTNVMSAPPNLTGRHAVTATASVKANFTVPLLRITSNVSCESVNSQSNVKQQLFAIVAAESFKILEKGVSDALVVLGSVRSKARERVAMIRSPSSHRDDDYATWKDLCSGCSSLRSLLREARRVIDQFCNVPLPLISDADSCIGSVDSKENCRLEGELLRLHQLLTKERKRAEDALEKLRAAIRAKEGMERAIVKQLDRTHCVLKKARGNLESQQHKHVSGSSAQ